MWSYTARGRFCWRSVIATRPSSTVSSAMPALELPPPLDGSPSVAAFHSPLAFRISSTTGCRIRID